MSPCLVGIEFLFPYAVSGNGYYCLEMSGLYRMNGVPQAYSDTAEEVQRGRDAKIAHLLKQVSLIYSVD